MATVEVSFTPLPAHVRTARLVATAVARRGGVPESLLDEVRLAVGEACSRAVEEHQRHCPAVPVHIRLMRDTERFEVTVTDAVPLPAPAGNGALPANGVAPSNGPSGNGKVSAAEPPDVDEDWSSGVGMAVIEGLADDVRITRTDAGLSISMTWNCRASSDSIIR
jgi:serine/threonine-protein kinase RsbW